jgi:hypothetical protein
MPEYLSAIECTDPAVNEWMSFSSPRVVFAPDIAVNILEHVISSDRIGLYQARDVLATCYKFSETNTLKLIREVPFDWQVQLAFAADCLMRMVNVRPEIDFAIPLVIAAKQYACCNASESQFTNALDAFVSQIPDDTPEDVISPLMAIQFRENYPDVPLLCAEAIAGGNVEMFQDETAWQSARLVSYLTEEITVMPF